MRNPRDTRHGRALPWLLGAIAVVLAAAAAVWWFGIRSEAEPEAKLRETPVVTDGDDRGVDGTWELSDPQRLGSFVGYRVQEQFAASIASQEATGRTSEVTGRLVIADGEVREAEVRANLAALRSDKDRRDQALRTRGLETDRFPEATFRLTEPIRLPDGLRPGRRVTAEATGELTLHGVTKTVTIPMEGRWDGRRIQVVGRLPIVFADYRIDPPNIGGFVTVEDRGEMELQLFFVRA
jgi:polyisoprenoid-binding protein YceI